MDCPVFLRAARTLGPKMNKTEATAKVAAIGVPLNLQERTASERCPSLIFWEGFPAFSTGERGIE